MASNGAVAVTVSTSQNVGIGTASPANKLHVSDTTTGTVKTRTEASTGYVDVGMGGNSGVFDTTATDGIRLRTSGNDRFAIDTSGNVLVGTTSQSSNEKFGVVQSSASAVGAYFNATSGGYGNDLVVLRCARGSATTEYFFIKCVQVSTTTFLVAANGNVTNTNNSYGSLSDVKLKENIVDATPKLDSLMQVKVRNYNLKSDPTHKQLGVIAQELEQVFPAMVEESPDRDEEGNDLGTTTKSVKYSVFVPMLIKAMQEQQATINALTARIVALESK
jgi:hypothetical protein